MIKRNILLNPGPATTTDSVKRAQLVPDICPREKVFADLMESVAQDLTSIVGSIEDYVTVLFSGSGTAAIESMITSVIPENGVLLVINNGAYGDRICQIARRFKINLVEFESSVVEPINLCELEKVLQKNGKISHLAVVHNETTTGLLNDLDALSSLSIEYNFDLIVDAMSSYAAIPIDMGKQNIKFLAASSNKNIQGMAGVSFVIANRESLDRLADIESRSFYLDLWAQHRSFTENSQMRFTPPVQTIYALKQAIKEARAEGISSRYRRYSKSWQVLTDTLKSLGLTYLVDDKYHSRIVTAIVVPSDVEFSKMHEFFIKKGYTIYPGKTPEFNTFRISNIGDIDSNDVENFLRLFKEYLFEIQGS